MPGAKAVLSGPPPSSTAVSAATAISDLPVLRCSPVEVVLLNVAPVQRLAIGRHQFPTLGSYLLKVKLNLGCGMASHARVRVIDHQPNVVTGREH
jgi:hypothetical protein